ncbi:MAG TPA: histidine kinase [Propionibacteriaceae bacterium]|nr:histidine kinase [Propionibacteriaceae bacterium]
MSTGGDAAIEDRGVSVVWLVVRFTMAGLLVMAVLATVIAYLARQAGTEQAIESARQVAAVTARGIAEPRLDDDVLAGDPAALTAFHDAMRRYVVQGSLVRVKLWDASGRIIYSDESRLIGRTFALHDKGLNALRRGETFSEVSDLTRPENEFDRSFEKLLQVYVGIQSASEQPLLFEVSFRYDAVALAGQAQWRKYAPPTLAGLLALQLVQVPFAWSLARRLQRQQRDRQRLLQHAIDASDAERRRIAADLHDGVVQQLTGLTYALDAARLGAPHSEQDAELIRKTAAQLRVTIGDLRSLLVDIYPPNLGTEGLPASLTDLARDLERVGLVVDLDVDETETLPIAASSVLYRCAQEILRNVAAHSDAREVQLTATFDGSTATLVVDDDGRGFDETDLAERLADGHLGLRSLGDLVAESHGQFTVRSAPGQGTRAEVAVPAQ